MFKFDKHNCKTIFYCRKRNITFKAVKVLSKRKRLCEKNEHCEMKFCEKKKFFSLKNFQNIPFCFRGYCNAECKYKYISDNRSAMNEKIFYQKHVSLNNYGNSLEEHNLPSGCHINFGDDFKEWFGKETHKP